MIWLDWAVHFVGFGAWIVLEIILDCVGHLRDMVGMEI